MIKSNSKLILLLAAVISGALVSGCASTDKKSDASATPASPASPSAMNAEKVQDDVANPALKDEPMPETLKKAGQTYLPLAKAARSGVPQSIADECAKILAVKPNDMVALNTLALYHYRKGRLGAAKLLINRAFEKNEPTAPLYNNLGVILLDEGDQGAAIINFKKALSLEEGNFSALGNLGSLYAKGGDYARATPLLAKAHSQNPNSVAVATNYAITLKVQGKFDEARKVYEDIVQKNRDDLAANFNLAVLLIDNMNKPKEGLVVVNRIKFLDTERKDVRARLNALEKKARAGVQ